MIYSIKIEGKVGKVGNPAPNMTRCLHEGILGIVYQIKGRISLLSHLSKII